MRSPAKGIQKRRSVRVKRAAPAVRTRKRVGTGPARRGFSAIDWRRVAIVSSAVLLAGGIALVIAVAPGWGRGAEQFRISRIDVRGVNALTPREVQELAELEEGLSLLSVSVPAVEQAILRSPRVARAQATKLLPDRVLIRVVEKEAIALVETSAGVYEVSEDLIALPRVESTPFADLPVVTGSVGGLEEGVVVDDPELESALSLLSRARGVSESLWMNMSEVRIAPGSGLVIYTVADGAEIRVGSGALDVRGLKRLAMVLTDIEQRGQRAESIDLRFEDQAIVRLRPGTAGVRA